MTNENDQSSFFQAPSTLNPQSQQQDNQKLSISQPRRQGRVRGDRNKWRLELLNTDAPDVMPGLKFVSQGEDNEVAQKQSRDSRLATSNANGDSLVAQVVTGEESFE